MKSFNPLVLLKPFHKFFEKQGVQYEEMIKILEIKLKMDRRRIPSVINKQRSKKQQENKDKNYFFSSLLVYGFMGVFLVPFILLPMPIIYSMSIVFSYFMFMLMTSLISDFSSVLLDVRDKGILYTKPVSLKTLNMAKLLHIIYYVTCITLAITGPALVAILLSQSILFFLIFFFFVILIVFMSIGFTALFYQLILQFYDGEKLKDIINYVQIILSVGIAIGYQFIGRAFQIVHFQATLHIHWWNYLLPPLWFAAPFDMLKNQVVTIHYIIWTVLAVILPFVVFGAYYTRMSRFEQSLQKLSNEGGSKKQKGNTTHPVKTGVGSVLCSSKEERLFFDFIAKVLHNERKFKLKVYPAIGMSFILPFIFTFSSLGVRSIEEISHGKGYFAIYLSALALFTSVPMVAYSENYKGAWIYAMIPYPSEKLIKRASLKVVTTQLFLPIFMFQVLLCTLFFGVRILPDVLGIFLMLIAFVPIVYRIGTEYLPFTQAYDEIQAGNTAKVLAMMLGLFVLYEIHFGISYIPYGSWGYSVVAFTAVLLSWRGFYGKEVTISGESKVTYLS